MRLCCENEGPSIVLCATVHGCNVAQHGVRSVHPCIDADWELYLAASVTLSRLLNQFRSAYSSSQTFDAYRNIARGKSSSSSILCRAGPFCADFPQGL